MLLYNEATHRNAYKKKVDKKKTKTKLDSKGNYKGTNIKPTKLQLERLKKRGLA